MKYGKHRACQAGVAKNVLIALFLMIFLGGLIYALYPVMTGVALMRESRKVAEDFIHTLPANFAPGSTLSDESDIGSDEQPAETPYPELLAAMQAYNERIYTEGQSGLVDAWAYTEPSFDLTEYGIENGDNHPALTGRLDEEAAARTIQIIL